GQKIEGATAATYQASQAGEYSADIITAACQGKAQNTAVITQGSAPSGSITPQSGTLCPGSTLTLTVSGGTAYQWYRNGQKIEGATAATYQASQAGEYSADIITAACQGKAQNTAVITQGSAITFDITVADLSCTNSKGKISIVNPSGGNGTNYQYSKDNGTTFQTSNTFEDLLPGEYTIIVKDGGGCKSSSKKAVVKPFASTLKINTTVSNIACNQSLGIITVFATGGSSPYKFSINGGASQFLNVFNGLGVGTYTITVVDAEGCTETISATIGITNSTLTAKAAVSNATCREKGSVKIEASGGASPYQYKLDGGAYQATSTFSNLEPGSRKVTVRDNQGCEFEVSFEVKESTGSPNLVITNPAKVCPGTTTNLREASITSGSEPDLVFTYWQDTTATTAVTNPAAVLPGKYFIKATNSGGCFTIKPVTVSVLPTQPGTILLQGPPLVCNGRSITLTASPGTAYQWYLNDTLITGATGRTYNAIVGGSYSVIIKNGSCAVRAITPAQIQFQDCITTPETNVFVPTAFTPNRNNENDLLRPVLYNITSLSYFKVYNRWGQLVFETNEIGRGWDGTIKGVAQPTETYSWILQCTDNSGNVIKKSGRSLLIR
ncbi:gliding motility-associated C-terminal domain-containing protein, partial [Flavisolibacter sp. BT320]|nr:gliding motility-associated C-terminal domain-containing protein [Flavisolibacter longurius]